MRPSLLGRLPRTLILTQSPHRTPSKNPSKKRIVSAVEQRGRGEQGATGYCPKLLLKRAKMVLSLSLHSIGVAGKSALEIGQFLRRNFWMIFGGPFLSRPLCFTADCYMTPLVRTPTPRFDILWLLRPSS